MMVPGPVAVAVGRQLRPAAAVVAVAQLGTACGGPEVIKKYFRHMKLDKVLT